VRRPTGRPGAGGRRRSSPPARQRAWRRRWLHPGRRCPCHRSRTSCGVPGRRGRRGVRRRSSYQSRAPRPAAWSARAARPGARAGGPGATTADPARAPRPPRGRRRRLGGTAPAARRGGGLGPRPSTAPMVRVAGPRTPPRAATAWRMPPAARRGPITTRARAPVTAPAADSRLRDTQPQRTTTAPATQPRIAGGASTSRARAASRWPEGKARGWSGPPGLAPRGGPRERLTRPPLQEKEPPDGGRRYQRRLGAGSAARHGRPG